MNKYSLFYPPRISSRIGQACRSIMAVLTLLSLGSSMGCDGGGGGDGFSGAAFVTLEASPHSIDIGDQIRVKVFISDVHNDGISLKIRYPNALQYVENSAVLMIDGDEVNIGPANNESASSDTYLIFYLSHDTFLDDTGELWIELEGAGRNQDAEIEVDADVDNPNISNDVEFDIDSPEFTAEDADTVTISG